MQRLETPVPERMRGLPKDHRGYPIFYTVMYDNEKKPLFAAVDVHKKMKCAKEDRCGICGQVLGRVRWFIGGPLSAYHTMGHYFDPHMHHECLQYALQVCPHLAISNYTKLIAQKTIAQSNATAQEGHQITGIDIDGPGYVKDKPDCFVAVGSRSTRWTGSLIELVFKPTLPFFAVEIWRDGVILGFQEAEKVLIPALDSALRKFEEQTGQTELDLRNEKVPFSKKTIRQAIDEYRSQKEG